MRNPTNFGKWNDSKEFFLDFFLERYDFFFFNNINYCFNNNRMIELYRFNFLDNFDEFNKENFGCKKIDGIMVRNKKIIAFFNSLLESLVVQFILLAFRIFR